MIVRFVPNYQGIGEVMRIAQVRKALHDEAGRIEARARSYAPDTFRDLVSVEDGTRPKGRSYSYVVIDEPDGENPNRGSKSARREVLSKASGTAVF